MRQRNIRRAPRGFTLLELLIVLVILAALAGILIPLLPNMTTRTHGAAGASNIGEVAKFIQTHEALYNAHPDGWDALIDETNAVVFEAGAGGRLAVVPVDAQIEAALGAVGITGSWLHDSTTSDATFAPYLTALPAVADNLLTDGNGSVVGLTLAGIRDLGLAPAGNGIDYYVAFGVGARNSMVGKSMVDAPVHFPEAGSTPAREYSRFVAVYAIPAEGPARLAAVCAAHEEGLSGLGQHLEEYFETSN